MTTPNLFTPTEKKEMVFHCKPYCAYGYVCKLEEQEELPHCYTPLKGRLICGIPERTLLAMQYK